MMKPFEDMWKKMNVPLKAKQPNGYDVIMAANMLGYLSIFDTETGRKALENLKEIQALQIAYGTLTHCVEFIKQNRLKINADEIRFGMYLANQKSLSYIEGIVDSEEFRDLFKFQYSPIHITYRDCLL